MDLIEYEHTKKHIVKKIIKNYLQGYSEHEIMIKTNIDIKWISNIIDCYNYLYI
jgi:hypothetical protein